ncbi:MAG: hypothetical protein IJ242_08265 [Clostridia bacterium]|nr:hypothetical protein [Clostridia bacterium]
MVSNPHLLHPDLPENPYIEENCPCPRTCPRHGNCFACLANHRDVVTSTPPACLRTLYVKKDPAES